MRKKIYSNPILSGFYPDPSICRVGNDYYLVNSTFSYFPGIPVFHSTDLIHWKQIGNVLNRKSQVPLDNNNFAGAGIYAPTIRFNNGIFYIITTNVGSSFGNFIVTATDPAGPWSNPILLESEGIDPSLFFDDDGRCYYCGTKERREGPSYYGDNEIYIQELDLNSMKLIGESWAAWHGALRGVEWPEGPHIYKKDGWYYLIISEAGTGHMHSVTVARSKRLDESFTGYEGNPILTHRHLGIDYPIVNVGHPDIIKTQNGEWWMVVLASRPYGGYYRNLGRETFLVPFRWENDWPLINPGKGIIEDYVTASDLPIDEPDTIDEYDTFDYDKLPLYYMFMRNPFLENYSLKDREGYIRLRLSPLQVSSKISSPTVLCRRQLDKSYELKTSLDFSPNEGETAGLLLLQNESFNYQFALTKIDGINSLIVIKCTKDDDMNTNQDVIVSVPLIESEDNMMKTLFLKAVQKEQNITFSYSYDSDTYIDVLADADARILSTDCAGGFVGTCLGIFASSNGHATDNFADFDWLYYKGI